MSSKKNSATFAYVDVGKVKSNFEEIRQTYDNCIIELNNKEKNLTSKVAQLQQLVDKEKRENEEYKKYIQQIKEEYQKIKSNYNQLERHFQQLQQQNQKYKQEIQQFSITKQTTKVPKRKQMKSTRIKEEPNSEENDDEVLEEDEIPMKKRKQINGQVEHFINYVNQ